MPRRVARPESSKGVQDGQGFQPHSWRPRDCDCPAQVNLNALQVLPNLQEERIQGGLHALRRLRACHPCHPAVNTLRSRVRSRTSFLIWSLPMADGHRKWGRVRVRADPLDKAESAHASRRVSTRASRPNSWRKKCATSARGSLMRSGHFPAAMRQSKCAWPSRCRFSRLPSDQGSAPD
jgi:hypothetical protein